MENVEARYTSKRLTCLTNENLRLKKTPKQLETVMAKKKTLNIKLCGIKRTKR